MIAWGEIERSRDVRARGGKGSIVAIPQNFTVYEGGRGGDLLELLSRWKGKHLRPPRTDLPPSVGGGKTKGGVLQDEGEEEGEGFATGTYTERQCCLRLRPCVVVVHCSSGVERGRRRRRYKEGRERGRKGRRRKRLVAKKVGGEEEERGNVKWA